MFILYTADDFVTRLRAAAKKCDYAGTEAEKEIKKLIILGCRSAQLKEAILAKGNSATTYTVNDIQAFTRTSEASKEQAQTIVKAEPEYYTYLLKLS